MNCMRCGKKVKDKNVFCPECLTDMERYPVKPGTVIHIPTWREPDEKQLRRKKELTPEEQLVIAEKQINTLKRWLICMTAAAALLGTLLYFSMTMPRTQEQDQDSRVRNYSIVTQD